MRRRSYTVYATSVEDFSKFLSDGSPTLKVTEQKNPAKAGNKRKASVGEVLWNDFDFNNSTAPPALATQERKRSGLTLGDDLGNDDEACPVKSLVVKKIMVMGLRGSGKHFVVNSAFHNEGEEELVPLRQTMDFVLKTEAGEGSETKYHFWIRELNGHKFESVVRVYYKIINLFIFVYSVTDRSSFEALDEAIESVLKEVPKEKFTGVLLANMNDPSKNCEVSHAEGVMLKEKHNLSLFMDTRDGEVREKLNEVLNVGMR